MRSTVRRRSRFLAVATPLVALFSFGVGCGGPRTKFEVHGLKAGAVTSSVTISCPGEPARTVSTLVSVEQCTTSGVYAVDFSLDGGDFRCLSPVTFGSPSTSLGGVACTGGALTQGTLVPGAFANGTEAYMSGSIQSDDQACALQITGPLYPGGPSIFCPQDFATRPVPDGGLDAGPDAGLDAGPDAG